MACASSSRPLPLVRAGRFGGDRISRKRRGTTAPRFWASPRMNTGESCGRVESCTRMARIGAPGWVISNCATAPAFWRMPRCTSRNLSRSRLRRSSRNSASSCSFLSSSSVSLLVVSEIVRRVIDFLNHGFHGWLRGAREDAVQRVVVLRRDRIELVIVAAGAGNGQTQKPLVTTSMRSLMMSLGMPMNRSPTVRKPSAVRFVGLRFVAGSLSAASCSMTKTL